MFVCLFSGCVTTALVNSVACHRRWRPGFSWCSGPAHSGCLHGGRVVAAETDGGRPLLVQVTPGDAGRPGFAPDWTCQCLTHLNDVSVEGSGRVGCLLPTAPLTRPLRQTWCTSSPQRGLCTVWTRGRSWSVGGVGALTPSSGCCN